VLSSDKPYGLLLYGTCLRNMYWLSIGLHGGCLPVLAFIGHHWLLWAFIGLWWLFVSLHGCYGPVLAFINCCWPLLTFIDHL
jgi:hypothetical protein